MEKKVLGRGLEALIVQDSGQAREKVQQLRIENIRASRFQPRLNFSQEKIEELARSIQEKGVIQPILVRAVAEDQYELIAGERRWRAVKHLGLSEIPAIVRRVADADLLEISIIENVQREELNPIEEAKAYRRLAQEFGHTQDHIANRVGKDKTSISNLLRILNLPDKIQDYISNNMISFGHAKVLLSIGEPNRQILFCEKIIQKGLSVRQFEQITGGFRSRTKSSRLRQENVELKAIEEKLQHLLGTKVRIHHGKKRGKIEIDYYSIDDLDRLLNILTPNKII